MNKIELYDASNIKSISWPATPNGQYEEKFLTPLIESGTCPFIDNIDLKMGVIKIDNAVLPLAITEGNGKIPSFPTFCLGKETRLRGLQAIS